MISIDRKRQKLVDVVTRRTPQDSSGDFSNTDTVQLENVVVDIQSRSGSISDASSGDKVKSTHLIIFQRYPKVIPEQHWIVKEKRRIFQYEIVKVNDYGDYLDVEANVIKSISTGATVPAILGDLRS